MAKGVFAACEQFDIVVKYMSVKLKSGVMSVKVFNPEDKEDQKLMEKYADRVQELNTIWEHPNFKTSNDMAKQCMVMDPYTGKREVELSTYRSTVLQTCLKGWDACDDDDKPVPCTIEFINKLDFNIALELTNQYFDRTTISEEEAKN